MILKQFILGRKAITFSIVLNPDTEDDTVSQEERKTIAKEAPNPELPEAFSNLAPIVCRILETSGEWVEGLSVFKLRLSHTKHGTRSVSFKFKKAINATGGMLHSLETPFVRIDKPADGESGDIEVSLDEKRDIERAIQECLRYANGERSQQILDMETASQGINALAELGRKADEGQGVIDFGEAVTKKRRKAGGD